MAEYYSRRNLEFLLTEVFDIEGVLKLGVYKKHDLDSIRMMLDAADQLAQNELHPYFKEMDQQEPRLEGGKVKVHPQVRSMMKKFGEGGWISASSGPAFGGMDLPIMISSAANYIFGAANFSASVFPQLSTGVARLIEHYGSDFLKHTYVPNLYNGAWQGTMAMTEPDAGSSLSDLKTKAVPINEENEIFRIKGQKIFISAGDHDGVGNVIHLVLARIQDAPEGTKGLSLFLVPQKMTNEEDKIVLNDIKTSGIYHKMGYKGTPIVHLSFGDEDRCYGYLLGEANQGLAQMFQMMNEARIGVGLSATAIASAAYYTSLNYAKERLQGRLPDEKDVSKPQVPIIKHADVKRMLLQQKAISEGSLSLLMNCARYADIIKGGGVESKEIYQLTLDLLTPVAKTFPSEYGVQCTANAIQIFGGAGYCKDFPVEQYYRDIKIHTLHEGTTGIHGLDLLGRKIIMGGGIAFRAFTEEVTKTIKKVKLEILELNKYGERLGDALFRLQNVTMRLSTMAMKEKKEVFMADATLYLELFGLVAVGWQWLLQAIPSQIAVNENRGDEFYESKLYTMRYYFEYELPKTESIITRLNSSDNLLVEVQDEHLI
ncbi:butyryl-CoA dehydrogenase [Reichenbachiella agariperforans]|uniref:Butyryl-CoA dehydrogenase n=1 Tax=Reichenbachiella agariperforans TaxID=156994 RepID=A0A1M6VN71_REIAG|nr:acyl-CoA dehydrogenase [Reichenbachiella agariperforans]SHK82814.1 butyryl-CoA dehydrogenase [Reichenbachiella agariperforans]